MLWRNADKVDKEEAVACKAGERQCLQVRPPLLGDHSSHLGLLVSISSRMNRVSPGNSQGQ